MRFALLATAVHALAATWRVRVEGLSQLAAARAVGPVLFAPWHEALVPLVWYHRHRGITLLVGRHADAELLAGVAHRLGYVLARGSSTRGGAGALRGLIRALAAGNDGALTPDGPRGPRRTAKLGALKAAQLAGAVIVPVTADATPRVRLRSWDRMLIPAPGARLTIRYGPGLTVAAGADLRHTGRAELQQALDRLAPAS